MLFSGQTFSDFSTHAFCLSVLQKRSLNCGTLVQRTTVVLNTNPTNVHHQITDFQNVPPAFLYMNRIPHKYHYHTTVGGISIRSTALIFQIHNILISAFLAP
jgi:hypothetical protein